MKGIGARFVGFSAGLLAVVSTAWILTGQAANPEPQGFPTDWSHRHVVFSRPVTRARAARVEGDPRYWQQFARTHIARAVSADGFSPIESEGHRRHRHFTAGSTASIHRDWAETMGNPATSGPGNYPAKYSFQTTTANCASAATPDYVVFNTGETGTSSQASIIAYDNLYSSCGSVQTYWAYNTGGQVLTSPVMSTDGTQIAFAQTNGSFATLVLLKWKSGDGTAGAPHTLTAVSNALYRACTASCMTTIILRDANLVATDDKTSSVFPDYTHDTIYVGGTSGWLHKIAGVFRGTPAEVNTGGFPSQVNNQVGGIQNPTTLSSPIYDYGSGNVIVGDYGGYVYRVNSAGVATPTAQLDHATGVVAAPIVDSTAGKIYVFSSNDGTTGCGGAGCTAVISLPIAFTSGATGTKSTVGSSSASPNDFYEGDFDSTYYNSANGTGNMYVCGNNGAIPTIYQIPITAGVPAASVTGPALSTATTACSPVTDVTNPSLGSEWIFVSAAASGVGSSCASAGCAYNFVVAPRTASTPYTAGQEILDSNFTVEVATTTGTTGTGGVTWPTTGNTVTDGGVTWLAQGTYAGSYALRQPSSNYGKGSEVLDSNGNLEVTATGGHTSSTATNLVAWSTTPGGTTKDQGVSWVMAGKTPTLSLGASGGTSGFVFDNTVTTVGGASQVYFSTLSTQTCTTSNTTGGCAVQASQSALQ